MMNLSMSPQAKAAMYAANKKSDARRRGKVEKNSGKKKWNNIIYKRHNLKKN